MNAALFDKLRTRARVGITLEGMALACAAFVLFAVVSYALDRTFRLEVAYRLVLMLIFVVLLGRSLHRRLLSPLKVRLDDTEMALAVERARPELKQALISAVQFEEVLERAPTRVESAELMRLVVDQVARSANDLDLGDAVDQRRVSRWAGLLLAAVGFGVAAAALAPEMVGLWFARNIALSSVEWPRDTTLQFAGSQQALRVPEGDDVTLTVAAAGVVPSQALLHYAFEGGERGVQPMTLTGDREFTLTLPSVLEDAVVYATGGDGQTSELRLEIVERPRIGDLELSVDYPDYMRRQPERLAETSGDLGIPRGGGLVVRARSSKPLVRAEWVFDESSPVGFELSQDGLSFEGRIAPEESGVLILHVLDLDRLDVSRPPRFRIRVLDDREPSVRFTASGIGSMITPIARIPGSLEVREDYGLTAVRAQYRVTDEVEASPEEGDSSGWLTAEVPGLDTFAAGSSTFDSEVFFDLRPLHPDPEAAPEDRPIRPGQFVTLRFSATDNFGPGAAQRGLSEAVVFRVVPRDKLLEDLSRRQAEQRRELELIVEGLRTAVAELREILSPDADSPRAAQARVRVLGLARRQRSTGRRVGGLADAYDLILDEYLNNRLWEPSNVAEMRGKIVSPLHSVAAEDFPSSAVAVQEFGQLGGEDLRNVAVLAYESILARLQQVLEQMEEAENFATLLEGLREAIKLQNNAIRATEKRRGEELQELFGPEDDKKK